MPLTAADFKRPSGRLSPAWFTDDLGTSLTAWLVDAGAVSSDEAAQAAWVYYRAYQSLADDRALVAASRSVGGVSESFTDEQWRHWQRLADDALSEFDGLSGLGGPYFTPFCM